MPRELACILPCCLYVVSLERADRIWYRHDVDTASTRHSPGKSLHNKFVDFPFTTELQLGKINSFRKTPQTEGLA
jgi:hypothetical protein